VNLLRRFIKTVPPWAFALVLLAIFVISVYLWARSGMQMYGGTIKFENNQYYIDYVQRGGPLDKAGIRPGDTLVSLNMMPVGEWENQSYFPGPGDTVIHGILRNNGEVRMPIKIISVLSFSPGLFWSIYIIMILFSAGSLYLLYKKPDNTAVKLLFLFITGYVITSNAQVLHGYQEEPIAMVASSIFMITGCVLGPVLIHFHLLFPKPSKLILRFKRLPLFFYFLGASIGICWAASYIHAWVNASYGGTVYNYLIRTSLWWLTCTFILALIIAIYQYKTIRDTLSRNQVLIVIIGAFFGCLTPIALSLFFDRISLLNSRILFFVPLLQGIGGLIMICCFLIAIFRYRIWDIEVFFKKALLYLGATLIIILSYLFLLFLVDLITISETRITRFIILAFSVIIFLVMRDWIQRLIERMFQREAYDSATVVSVFEEKLAGIYHVEELKAGIVNGLDSIFHFKSFVLNLKKDDGKYQPVYCLGTAIKQFKGDFEGNSVFENKLLRSKIFSPLELDQKPVILEAEHGELVVPLLKDDRSFGFFLCGPKKSEKTYSMQDIRVLSLIAKRVTALFQTAALYQKDLDRQLMLERERARISQDMHDDIGASLTRISMMSELVKNREDVGDGARQWLGQISGTSSGLMEEMNQIIWALNPKNDNLEGLVTYLRRFAFGYLEPTSIECIFDLPEEMPGSALSVEVRRNVYLVAREALHNIVKHSGATKVRIILDINEHGFRILIKDDGKGFNPGKLDFPGNGLVNMKKRMKEIGGELIIHAEPGKGTELMIDVAI
jgi:signal transduction histidine kinase